MLPSASSHYTANTHTHTHTRALWHCLSLGSNQIFIQSAGSRPICATLNSMAACFATLYSFFLTFVWLSNNFGMI